MRRGGRIALVAGALVIALALPAQAATTYRTEFEVPIDRTIVAERVVQFSGNLTSPKAACRKDRRIMVVFGDARTDYGEVQSEPDGSFVIDGDGPTNEYYEIKVFQKAIRRFICKQHKYGVVVNS